MVFNWKVSKKDLIPYFLGGAIFCASVSYFSVRFFFLNMLFSAGALLLCSGVSKASYGRFWYVFLGATGILLGVLFFSFLGDVYANFMVKVLLIYVLVLVFSYCVFCCGADGLLAAIYFYLFAHVVIFLIQFCVSNFFGYYIEFDKFFRDDAVESLHLSRSLSGLWLQSRGGGAFSEPSFYAMSILPFCLFYVRIKGRIDYLAFISLFSVVLSFSIAAIALTVLAFIILFLHGYVSKKHGVVTFFLAIFIAPVAASIYQSRIVDSLEYDALESRSVIFDEIAMRDLSLGLLGEGFLWDELEPQGALNLQGYEIRDSSFYVYLIFGSGYLGFVLFFIFLFFYGRHDFKIFLYFLISIFFKYHFVSATIWYVLAVFLCFTMIAKKETKYIMVDGEKV